MTEVSLADVRVGMEQLSGNIRELSAELRGDQASLREAFGALRSDVGALGEDLRAHVAADNATLSGILATQSRTLSEVTNGGVMIPKWLLYVATAALLAATGGNVPAVLDAAKSIGAFAAGGAP